MLSQNIKNITINDINNLLAGQVREGRSIEYKLELPGTADGDKKEFLADISSFANTDGGHLIYGIQESAGIPTLIGGVTINDQDAELLRLESIIRDGLDPRIQYSAKWLQIEAGKAVLILAVQSSLIGPHRVIFKDWSKFFGRNSSGKYSLDVVELRSAFLRSSTIEEKIKNFRINRLFEIRNGKNPVRLKSTSRFISVHIIPLSAFTTSQRLENQTVLDLSNNTFQKFSPFNCGGYSHKINLDGVVAYTTNHQQSIDTYVQVYRTGIIEAVETGALARSAVRDDEHKIPAAWLEINMAKYIGSLIHLENELGISGPYYVFLSLAGIKGFILSSDRHYTIDPEAFTDDDLIFPDIVFEDSSIDPLIALRPIFDMFWNAGGVSRSLNYNDQGEYIAANTL